MSCLVRRHGLPDGVDAGGFRGSKYLPRYHLVTHLTGGAIRITIVFSDIYSGR